MRVSLILVTLALLAAGCTGPGSPKDSGLQIPDCPVPSVASYPAGADVRASVPTSADRFSSLLVLAKTKDPIKTLEVTAPKDAKWEQKVLGTGNQTFFLYNVKARFSFGPVREDEAIQSQQAPPPFGSNVFTVNLTVDPQKAACQTKEKNSLAWSLMPANGRGISAGKGVHVRYASYGLDGSLLETNMPAVENSKEWPRGAGYAYTGPGYREIYVYNADPSEKPSYWSAPQDPTGARAFDYKTLPKAFNEALKGHAAGQPKAFASPASDAPKASPGAETLTLFLVDEVVDYPCPPSMQGRCALGAGS